MEDTVMSFLKMVHRETPTFTVVLWYNESEMNSKSLLEFRTKYRDDIEMLEIEIIPMVGIEVSVWYDIIGTDDEDKLDHFQFRSMYNNIDDIVNCIMEFNSMIKFNKQKNSGYRNAKDRNYRFKAMGKQTKD
jgi:hypothetical protein